MSIYQSRLLEKRVSEKQFVEIMKEAVEIEIEFITKAIPCRMIGMNAKSMIIYIKFIADRLAPSLNSYLRQLKVKSGRASTDSAAGQSKLLYVDALADGN